MTPIDADKLKLEIVDPEPEEQTQEAIPRVAAKQEGKTDKASRLQFDPHLQEETRREKCNQPPSLKTSRQNRQGPRKVDVIARLNKDLIAKLGNTKEPVDGLHVFHHIGGGIVTGKAEVKKIPGIRKELGEEGSLKEATDIHLDLYHSVPAIACDPEPLEGGAPGFPGLDGSGVLIGIVDVGCDFRHKNFRYASGATRIRLLWDQTDPPEPPQDSVQQDPQQQPPKDFYYGREFTADQINEALRKGDDTAYQTLGYIPTAGAHGTHVMDIAAGNGREPALFGGKEGPSPAVPSHPGVAPNAQIVFVHLRTLEGGELGNSRHLLEAVYYIFQKADELKLPAVVNLSLSTSGGPHDGTTLVEQGFKALVEAKPGRAIVTSAGNSYQKQAHLSQKLSEGASTTILWHTDPRHVDPDSTKNEVEIWYPQGQGQDQYQAQDQGKARGQQEVAAELEVTLYAPNGKKLGPIPLGDTADLNEYDSDSKKPRRVGRVSHRYKDPNNGHNQIDIRIPHVDERPWKIELKAVQGAEIEFHAWIEQDDQGLSYFEGETDPFYTLGSISCSDATLTVGAFDTADGACLGRPFEATSAGPTRRVPLTDKKTKGKRDKPDLSAPGVRIVAARAQGGVTSLSGTSMAAAHVTGLVALIFQLALRSGKGPLPFSTLRTVLTEGAAPLESDAFHLDLQVQLGGGRINGAKSMGQVLQQKPDSVAIDLQPVLDSKAQRPDAPPSRTPETSSTAMDPSDPAVLKSLIELMKDRFYIHSNNGFGELTSLNQFMKEHIDDKKGFRISIGPLS